MALELNKVMIVGRLTKDPDVRMTNTGKQVAKLDLAINRKGYGSGQDEVVFIGVVAWEHSAKFAQDWLRQGSLTYVEGRLRMETWVDKQTGSNRSKIEITAERLSFAGSKGDSGDSGSADPSKESARSRERATVPQADEVEDQDDLPF